MILSISDDTICIWKLTAGMEIDKIDSFAHFLPQRFLQIVTIILIWINFLQVFRVCFVDLNLKLAWYKQIAWIVSDLTFKLH